MLKDLCKDRELKVSGNKVELVQRLEDYDSKIAKVVAPTLFFKAFVKQAHACVACMHATQQLPSNSWVACNCIVSPRHASQRMIAIWSWPQRYGTQ